MLCIGYSAHGASTQVQGRGIAQTPWWSGQRLYIIWRCGVGAKSKMWSMSIFFKLSLLRVVMDGKAWLFIYWPLFPERIIFGSLELFSIPGWYTEKIPTSWFPITVLLRILNWFTLRWYIKNNFPSSELKYVLLTTGLKHCQFVKPLDLKIQCIHSKP